MDGKGVDEAFEILLEELEKLLDNLSKEGEKAFREKDFEKAKKLICDGEKIRNFRKSVESLQEEWQKSFSVQYPEQDSSSQHSEKVIEEKREYAKKRGLKTHESKYYIPILEALVELGGSAETEVVLERVYQKMQGILNEFDLELLPSRREFRCINTAQWARLRLVKEGFLSSNSPFGIWEITDKGREYLKNAK